MPSGRGCTFVKYSFFKCPLSGRAGRCPSAGQAVEGPGEPWQSCRWWCAGEGSEDTVPGAPTARHAAQSGDNSGVLVMNSEQQRVFKQYIHVTFVLF